MKKKFFCLLFSMLLIAGFGFAQDQNSNTGINTSGGKDTTATHTRSMSKHKKEHKKVDKKDVDKKDHDKNKAGAMGVAEDRFVKEAKSGGMMEVELGRYAKDNASSSDVKDFGDMMVTDHSKANDELMDIFKKDNKDTDKMMMPMHKKNYDQLTKLKGSDFDKKYMRMMVEDHKKDIKEFEKAAKNEKNPDVKKWAENTLPTLKKHLQKAEEINGKLSGSEKTMKNKNTK